MISAEEIERPRPAAEFLTWIENRMREVASEPLGKDAIRFRRGPAKQLVEEALPIGLFASKHYGDTREVVINLVLGNQRYDALVHDKRAKASPISHIEVTQAHEGENEHLRMLALDKDGHVNVLGQVTKKGMKATGISVEVENVALSHREVLDRELQLIREAIERKREKVYPAETALLIVFDDYIAIGSDEDVAALGELLDSYLPRLAVFRWVAIVGWSGRTFLERDNKANAI